MRIFFFFKQKTAYEMRISDWSSDVCSSDLFQLTTFIVEFGDAEPVENGVRLLLCEDRDAGIALLLCATEVGMPAGRREGFVPFEIVQLCLDLLNAQKVGLLLWQPVEQPLARRRTNAIGIE